MKKTSWILCIVLVGMMLFVGNVKAITPDTIIQTEELTILEAPKWQVGGDYGEYSTYPRWQTELNNEYKLDLVDLDLDEDESGTEFIFDDDVFVGIEFIAQRMEYAPAIEIASYDEMGEKITIARWVIEKYVGQRVKISASEEFTYELTDESLIINIVLKENTLLQITGLEGEIGDGWYSLLPFGISIFAFTSVILDRTKIKNPFKIRNENINKYVWVIATFFLLIAILVYQGNII